MDLPIAKRHNSFARRIPSAVVRQAGLHDSSTMRAQVTADGAPAIQTLWWNRASFAAQLDMARAALPMGASVIDLLRQSTRF